MHAPTGFYLTTSPIPHIIRVGLKSGPFYAKKYIINAIIFHYSIFQCNSFFKKENIPRYSKLLCSGWLSVKIYIYKNDLCKHIYSTEMDCSLFYIDIELNKMCLVMLFEYIIHVK
jgi:hypothetical protein